MGKKERGKRDGTGPYKSSYQEQKIGKGKRKELGEPCEFLKKESKGR